MAVSASLAERATAGDRIYVPISWAAVEGSPAEANPNIGDDMTTDAVLWRRHERPTDNIYASQADISFRSAVNNIWDNSALSFPIIPDQDLSVGNPGDVMVVLTDDGLDFNGELGDTLLAAYEAWEDLDTSMSSQVYGIVAVNANMILDNDPDFTVGGVGGGFGEDSELNFRFTVVMDNTYLYPGTGNDTFGVHDPKDILTGHEFGHALGLHHVQDVNNLMNGSGLIDNNDDGNFDNVQLTNSQVNTVRDRAGNLGESDPPNIYIPSPLVTRANVDRTPDSTGTMLGPHEDLKMTFVDLDRATDKLRVSQMLGGLISNVPSIGAAYEFWTFMNTDDNTVTGASFPQLLAIGAPEPFLGGELVLRVRVDTELVDVNGEFELQPVLDGAAWQIVDGSLVPVPAAGVTAKLPQLMASVTFLEEGAPTPPDSPILEAVTLEIDNSLLVDPFDIDEFYLFETLIARPGTPSASAEITDRLANSDIGLRSLLQETSFPHAFNQDDDVFPHGVPIGETIDVLVEGLLPNAPYHGIFGPFNIDPGMTDTDGSVQFELTIPAGLMRGPHLLTVGIDGTALTADMLIDVVPEPGAMAITLALATCGSLIVRRRRRSIGKPTLIGTEDRIHRCNAPNRLSVKLLALLIIGSAILTVPRNARAGGCLLPTQNAGDPQHLDVNAPFCPFVPVYSGETYTETFADELNSAANWYAEFLISNPSDVEVEVSMQLVWPGGSTLGTWMFPPHTGYVEAFTPIDFPETKSDWVYRVSNPTDYNLEFDASVSEALSINPPPLTGGHFIEFDGTPAPPGIGNFTPGHVSGPVVSVQILPAVPEPTGLVLATFAGVSAFLSRGRQVGTEPQR
jgi:hypothetical protein